MCRGLIKLIFSIIWLGIVGAVIVAILVLYGAPELRQQTTGFLETGDSAAVAGTVCGVGLLFVLVALCLGSERKILDFFGFIGRFDD